MAMDYRGKIVAERRDIDGGVWYEMEWNNSTLPASCVDEDDIRLWEENIKYANQNSFFFCL